MRTLLFTAAVLMLSSCGPMTDEELEAEELLAIPQGLGEPLKAINASCLQLKDSGTWTTYATNVSTVGSAAPMITVLGDLNRVGPVLGTDHPPAPGYKTGFKWNAGDMSTRDWIPQGMTAGVADGKNVIISSWYNKTTGSEVNKGVRVSIVDISTMKTSVNYRHVLLVEPTSAGNFVAVKNHGGGLSWIGNYLYEADTGKGVRVFDLRLMRRVNAGDECASRIGKYNSTHCAYGYAYVLPQVSAYFMPAARADGAAISDACKPKFSYLGKDTRGTDGLLSGEYCSAGDTESPCDVSNSTGTGGRIYRWLVGTDGRLVTSNGFATVQKAFQLNVPNAQGIAPIMTAGAPTDSFWIASSYQSGQLIRVATNASAKRFLSSSKNFCKIPEGMHATASGTNLWTMNEGYGTVTSPNSGGRVVFAIAQSSVD